MTTIEGEDGEPRSITLKLQNSATLDFENIPITRREGRILYLRDFATIKWREALPSSYFRINGLNVVTLSQNTLPSPRSCALQGYRRHDTSPAE